MIHTTTRNRNHYLRVVDISKDFAFRVFGNKDLLPDPLRPKGR